MANAFEKPEQWIINWGIAALEADSVVNELQRELRLGEGFFAFRKRQLSAGESLSMTPVIEKKLTHYAFMEQQGRDLLSILLEWRERARAMPPEALVDPADLNALFDTRTSFSQKMEQNFGTRHLLPGNAHVVWEDILQALRKIDGNPDFTKVASALRPFVESKITGWRGHRLFGLEPEFPNNWQDFRGQDPLISIASDPLLGTQSEHNYGFSIWLDREKMAEGDHRGGQFIHHCAV